MASLGMKGPFPLSEKNIYEEIPEETPGNYALGYQSTNGKFKVKYVGRSDDDLNRRLNDWIGKYRKFKYIEASSKREAFNRECHNYHDFGEASKLDNDHHPDLPNGLDLSCPVCGK